MATFKPKFSNLLKNSEISVQDIEDTYNGLRDNEHITDRDIASTICADVAIEDNSYLNAIMVSCTLSCYNGELTENLITRFFYLQKEQKSLSFRGGTGRVVINNMFILKPEYHKKGIAKALYLREQDLYKRWKTKEIHLHAIREGRRVWSKLGFGFVLTEADFTGFLSAYIEWFEDEMGLSESDIPPTITNQHGYSIAHYEDDFFESKFCPKMIPMFKYME